MRRAMIAPRSRQSARSALRVAREWRAGRQGCRHAIVVRALREMLPRDRCLFSLMHYFIAIYDTLIFSRRYDAFDCHQRLIYYLHAAAYAF